MSLLTDAEAVQEALARQSPQDARALAQSSGIEGERLQMAVVWLDLNGRVERWRNVDEDRTSSFSRVRLKETHEPLWSRRPIRSDITAGSRLHS